MRSSPFAARCVQEFPGQWMKLSPALGAEFTGQQLLMVLIQAQAGQVMGGPTDIAGAARSRGPRILGNSWIQFCNR
jgi:hypothetical protein